MKRSRLNMRITVEQEAKLRERAKKYGFSKKSDYVRFALFKEQNVYEKIDAIYQKVVKDGS